MALTSLLSLALLTLLCLSVTADRSVWAVVVSTSRYWFNYRHASNSLSIYHAIKAAGIPDSHILTMIPDDYGCSPRNGEHSAQLFSANNRSMNLYENIEIDYRGEHAVTVESLLRLLTNRHHPTTPNSQRLLSDSQSSVLLYLSGHGGNGFLKFQDQEELSSVDLADAIASMHRQGRYGQLMLVIDTCQAESMHEHIDSPNTLSITASRVGQNSYSAGNDPTVGLAISDRFTASVLSFFTHARPAWQTDNATVADLIAHFHPSSLMSDPVVRVDHWPRPLEQTYLHEFFAARSQIRTDTDSGSERRIAAAAIPIDTNTGSGGDHDSDSDDAAMIRRLRSFAPLNPRLFAQQRKQPTGLTATQSLPPTIVLTCLVVASLSFLVDWWMSTPTPLPS